MKTIARGTEETEMLCLESGAEAGAVRNYRGNGDCPKSDHVLNPNLGSVDIHFSQSIAETSATNAI